jgi:hypothetical protein
MLVLDWKQSTTMMLKNLSGQQKLQFGKLAKP